MSFSTWDIILPTPQYWFVLTKNDLQRTDNIILASDEINTICNAGLGLGLSISVP